jgi:hypothetical protein
VRYKSIFLSSLCAFLVITGSCHKSSPTEVNKPAVKLFGTFNVALQGDIEDPQITTVVGMVNDGPSPNILVYDKIDSVDKCVLYKSRVPFCQRDCGDATCVENDSCLPDPNVVDVGPVTVKGFKIAGVETTFTMKLVGGTVKSYQSPTLDLPPCPEGATVTFSAAGTSTIPAFTLSARAITPLVLLNDTFPCVDHQPINVHWAPPAVTGFSYIYVLIDISYHGTSKGKIESYCEDNGSLTVAASLLDKLKTYGISGYPKIEIHRMSTGFNAATNTKLEFESKVIRFLSIPGVISCSDQGGQCPNGQTCGDDQRCH